MKQILTGGLPPIGQPFSWGVKSRGIVYTTHGPVQTDGTILNAGIEAQTDLSIRNLQAVLEEAGGSLADVVQVQIFLLDVADMAPVDKVYSQYFTAPYPNRASLIVAGLVAPNMRIEIVATADLG